MGVRDEILEQPSVLRRWLDTQLEHTARIARSIQSRQIDFVFLAARGSSDHAGVYAQYTWGSLNRLPVALAAPSLYTRYGRVPRLKHALVVGISQSGQSPDVVSVVQHGREQGALTLAITNAPASPLAGAAEFHLDLLAGEERAVAATKSYTAELLAVAALAAELADSPALKEALQRIPAAVESVLGLEAQTEAIAAQHAEMTRAVVLGRGYNYATALEWAIKLKELAYVFADPYSTADFQHGPIAIVERGFPILAVAPRGAVLPDILALLKRVRDEQGAAVFVLSDDPSTRALGDAALALPSDVPEWLSPIVSIVPAQLYCYHLTRAKGYDPDAPRGLTKVTLTS